MLQSGIGEAVTYADDVGSVLGLSDLGTVGLGSPNNNEKKIKIISPIQSEENRVLRSRARNVGAAQGAEQAVAF